MTLKDGGPAFPGPTDMIWENKVTGQAGKISGVAQPGMSLRDYFAAKALTGLLANSGALSLTPGEHARTAYRIADAMLKAGEEGERS